MLGQLILGRQFTVSRLTAKHDTRRVRGRCNPSVHCTSGLVLGTDFSGSIPSKVELTNKIAHETVTTGFVLQVSYIFIRDNPDHGVRVSFRWIRYAAFQHVCDVFSETYSKTTALPMKFSRLCFFYNELLISYFPQTRCFVQYQHTLRSQSEQQLTQRSSWPHRWQVVSHPLLW
jgi:hypothetical protein